MKSSSGNVGKIRGFLSGRVVNASWKKVCRKACILCSCFLFATLQLEAQEELVDVDLTAQVNGTITATSSTFPNLSAYTGPKSQEEWGSIEVGAAPEGTDAPAGAIIFKDKSEAPGQGAALRIKTPGFGSHSADKGSVLLRMMIPIAGAYRAVLFFGNDWKDSAAILIYSKGQIMTFVADKAPTVKRGIYVPNKWQDLKVEFDFSKRKYSISIDGEQIAQDIPWITPDLKSIGAVSIISDDSPINREGAPVLYISKIKVVNGTE